MNWIHTDSTCYEAGQPVEVMFKVPKPSGVDWVAILPSHLPEPSARDYDKEMWLSTCGTQAHFCKREFGRVTFAFDQGNFLDLDSGYFNAYLFQSDSENPVAASATFKVGPKGLPCNFCNDAVTTLDSVYVEGEDIELLFDNCQPAEDDWVAIYPEDANPENLGDATLWRWACGSQTCRGKVFTDIVTLGPYIKPGRYRAILAERQHGGPYSAKVVSEVFEVVPAPDSGCKDIIEMSSSCYVQGEEIEYNYISCNPKEDDWVGIYPASVDSKDRDEPQVYSWSCGNTQCHDKWDSETDEDSFGQGSTWPLRPGDYEAVLVHENKGATIIASFAETSFTIKPAGETCAKEARRNLRPIEK